MLENGFKCSGNAEVPSFHGIHKDMNISVKEYYYALRNYTQETIYAV